MTTTDIEALVAKTEKAIREAAPDDAKWALILLSDWLVISGRQQAVAEAARKIIGHTLDPAMFVALRQALAALDATPEGTKNE